MRDTKKIPFFPCRGLTCAIIASGLNRRKIVRAFLCVRETKKHL